MNILHLVLMVLVAVINGFAVQAQPFKCGQSLPPFFASEKQLADLREAEAMHRADSGNAENIIWLARRQGYAGMYSQAIATLSHGIALYPSDARMYRHRGHRHLTLRCFDKAIADLEKAATLVTGKPDEIEPDGQPNDAGIPTSTLHTNIYYHLGLAYYLRQQWLAAIHAWEKCHQMAANPDMKTAAANWLYASLKRQGADAAAYELLSKTDFESPLLENHAYREILLLHKQKPVPQQALQKAKQGTDDVQNATYLYGLYLYLLLNNHPEYARQAMALLMQTKQYASFGYIAAEQERME